MTKDATLSPDGQYRYKLTRQWGGSNPAMRVTWIMLNPSTADATIDDPTIRRCIAFSKRWGFDTLEVVNLYALRSSDPSVLWTVPDPYGPENTRYLTEALHSPLCIAAWGAGVRQGGIPNKAFQLIRGRSIYCLGLTKDGHPRHPLYVRGDTTRMEWTLE